MTEKVKGQIEHIDAELKELCKAEDLQMFMVLTDNDAVSIGFHLDNERCYSMLTTIGIGLYDMLQKIFVSVDEDLIDRYTETMNKVLKLKH